MGDQSPVDYTAWETGKKRLWLWENDEQMVRQ